LLSSEEYTQKNVEFVALLSLVLYFQRKRGGPGSKFAKSKTEQKPALFDSSCRSDNYSDGDNDNDFEPPTPMVRS
jgi:hypothetical protein